MAYEQMSAVSPQSAALSAQFGNQGNADRLGFAELQQRGRLEDLARGDRTAERAENREDRLLDRNMQMEQFKTGTNLQQQGIDLQKQGQATAAKQFTSSQEHAEKMQANSQKFEADLVQSQQEIENERKILELRFAQAVGLERQQLAEKVMDVRSKSGDISAKMAAKKMLENRTREEITRLREHTLEMATGLESGLKNANELGARSAAIAGQDLYNKLSDKGREINKQIKTLESGSLGNFLGTEAGDTDALGFSFLAPTDELISSSDSNAAGVPFELASGGEVFGGSTAGLIDRLSRWTGMTSSDQLVRIDDSAINNQVNQTIYGSIGTAISQASGGKIPPDQVAQVLQMADPNGKATPVEIVQKLAEFNLSGDAIKSALLHLADSIQEGSESTPYNIPNLRSKREEIIQANGGEASLGQVAMDANLKFAQSLASSARTIATKIEGTADSVEQLQKVVGYLDRAVQGRETINRKSLADLVPQAYGKYDETLRDRITNSRDLEGAEKYAADYAKQNNIPQGQVVDVLGGLNREISGYEGQMPALSREEQMLNYLIENASGNPQMLENMIQSMSKPRGRR